MSSAEWPALQTAEATTAPGAPSFAYFARCGYDDGIHDGKLRTDTSFAAASPPTPSTSSGQPVAKNARMGALRGNDAILKDGPRATE
jgi:hypothetical protein